MIKKMIAVWGSNGSGKSCTSLAIGNMLTHYKKNVLIINTSTSIPHLPVFIPSLIDTSAENSVGSLLSEKNITEEKLKNKINIHPHNKMIGIMALASGENPFTYGEFERSNILEFFRLIDDSPFDYIIFDCESNPIYDTTTLIALEVSDVRLELITPDIKGAEFLKTQTSYLKQEKKYSYEKYIKIISPLRKDSPLSLINSIIDGYEYTIPLSKEANNAFSAGAMPSSFSQREGILYLKSINKIVKEQILIE